MAGFHTRLIAAATLPALAPLLTLHGTASAHVERPAQFPTGAGHFPAYRTSGPYLVVCAADSARRIAALPVAMRATNERLNGECRRRGFHDIQAAVDAVTTRGTRILVLPGVDRELPGRAPLSVACEALLAQRTMSYAEQVACPHAQHLIAILGDGPDDGIGCDGRLCDLQIEGTGDDPGDVVVDGDFSRHVVIRADRTDGVYFRNFTVEHAHDFGLYIIETDGFVIDRMVGRWNDAYGFLTFADDHGLYVDCEGYGNGDSGLDPGAASPQYGARPAIEITRCRSHHNWVGLGGTAGNSPWVRDNDFYDNSVGIALDSVFPNHPGCRRATPGSSATGSTPTTRTSIASTADGACAKPSWERGYEHGVVCPTGPGPIGTGAVLAGGNANEFRNNWVWDNWRYGLMQFWVPASVRGETDPTKLFDTSHLNSYVGNHLGVSPDSSILPNGIDLWWDEEGAGNCWQDNGSQAGPATSDPAALPDCSSPAPFTPPNLAKGGSLLACLTWSRRNVDPSGCNWTTRPTPPAPPR